MLVQISSGQGPAECELAVGNLYKVLNEEFDDIKMIEGRKAREDGCYTFILFRTDEDLSELEGTVQWICKSPFRPNHKRKNWFVDISIIPEAEEINMEKNIKFERFHCGGNGGQNVNKVETGVRLIHIPTGITVTSTAERTQHLNRKDAMKKLMVKLSEKQSAEYAKQLKEAWQQHNQIVRGNPVRVYEGTGFKRKK